MPARSSWHMRCTCGAPVRSVLLPACLFATLLASVGSAQAQATFFDVPSADLPERGQTLAQLQAAAGEELELGAVLAAGIGAQTEVGLTLYNLTWERAEGELAFASNASDTEDPFAPVLVATGQKLFGDKDSAQLSLGAQAGSNLASWEHLQFVARAYALLVLDLEERGRCTLGPYVASPELLGAHQYAGAFMGCEVEALPRRFGFEIEWDAGAGALGKLSVGPRVHIGHWGALSVGAQIPNSWSDATWRALAQLEATYPGQQE